MQDVRTDEPQALPRSALVLYALALCAVALVYSLITNHIWEDALITLRPAENMVNGQGLTYHVGTRVQTFTSPINVLMLALCYVLSGKGLFFATLWWYRAFSIIAFALSGVLLLQAIAQATPRWPVSLWWLAVVYALDVKAVAFSSNGMETGYLLLFVAWAIYLLSPPQPARWLARGLCWAGLMWTRPDGCVYIAFFAAAELLFSGTPKKATFPSLIKSAVVCAVVYSPWFFWAWSYYGSPIPNTISAKLHPMGPMFQLWRLVDQFSDRVSLLAAYPFRQVYPHFRFLLENVAIQRLFDGATKSIGIFCLVYWLFPVNDRLGRTASFCFAALCVYLGYQWETYPWYLPPAALFGYVTLERAFATFIKGRARSKHQTLIQNFAIATLVLLALGQGVLFRLTTWEMTIQQTEIELGTRAQVGIWLREHGKPTDTVYVEPLGYIGYCSGMVMEDYPGLASPKVVQLQREKNVNQIGLIRELMADWVILRPVEYQRVLDSSVAKLFEEHYEFKQEFDAHSRLEKYAFIPGRGYIECDASFLIFRRKS